MKWELELNQGKHGTRVRNADIVDKVDIISDGKYDIVFVKVKEDLKSNKYFLTKLFQNDHQLV